MKKPETTPESGVWQRANGQLVSMADMNPYHRAAAIRKAESAGNTGLADALRASGELPK